MAAYMAASLVLPESLEEWPDLDVYIKHRRLVLGLMLFCFLVVVGFRSAIDVRAFIPTV